MRNAHLVDDSVGNESAQVGLKALVGPHTLLILRHFALQQEISPLCLAFVAALKVEPLCDQNDCTSDAQAVEESDDVVTFCICFFLCHRVETHSLQMLLYVSMVLLCQRPLGILFASECRAVILQLDGLFKTAKGFNSGIFCLKLVLLYCFPNLNHVNLVVLFGCIVDLVVVVKVHTDRGLHRFCHDRW